MALSFPAFAGEWQEDMNGWKYQNDDGSYCRNGWYWLDGDHDGWAQCYYFGNTGYARMTDYGRADGYRDRQEWRVERKQCNPGEVGSD